jgi:hypothetical protein
LIERAAPLAYPSMSDALNVHQQARLEILLVPMKRLTAQ